MPMFQQKGPGARGPKQVHSICQGWGGGQPLHPESPQNARKTKHQIWKLKRIPQTVPWDVGDGMLPWQLRASSAGGDGRIFARRRIKTKGLIKPCLQRKHLCLPPRGMAGVTGQWQFPPGLQWELISLEPLPRELAPSRTSLAMPGAQFLGSTCLVPLDQGLRCVGSWWPPSPSLPAPQLSLKSRA